MSGKPSPKHDQKSLGKVLDRLKKITKDLREVAEAMGDMNASFPIKGDKSAGHGLNYLTTFSRNAKAAFEDWHLANESGLPVATKSKKSPPAA